MKSIGHVKLLNESINQFLFMFNKYDILNEYRNVLAEEIVKPDTSDKKLKPLGSHYAIYDSLTNTFNNRIKKNKDNAYTLLTHYFDIAVTEKDEKNSFIALGWALHFVMDMNTIPHAIGLTDAKINTFIKKPHKKYELYTQDVIEKYYKKIELDTSFFEKDIFSIMVYNVELKETFRNKVKKQYYDEINYVMIPEILKYTMGFIYKYFYERSKIYGLY